MPPESLVEPKSSRPCVNPYCVACKGAKAGPTAKPLTSAERAAIRAGAAKLRELAYRADNPKATAALAECLSAIAEGE